jgi:hypothetical protein
LLAAKGQFPVHRQRSEAIIDPVQEGNDEKDKDKRNNAYLDLPDGSGFDEQRRYGFVSRDSHDGDPSVR